MKEVSRSNFRTREYSTKSADPAKRRRATERVREVVVISERRACRVLEQGCSTQRRQLVVKVDEARLREAVIDLALEYGRQGYRQITKILRLKGWRVNHKRVGLMWRPEGLRVPPNTAQASDAVVE